MLRQVIYKTSRWRSQTLAQSRGSTFRQCLPPSMTILQQGGLLQIRSLVAAPKAGGPPILERREDRELPDIRGKRTYIYSIPVFIVTLIISAGALFNYQRSSSSVVASTLYALRVNPQVRDILGDEITFRSKMPWINGTLDQLHGRIDINYAVKGTKGEGVVFFKSLRQGGRQGLFKTVQWDLEVKGERLHLLVDEDKLAFS